MHIGAPGVPPIGSVIRPNQRSREDPRDIDQAIETAKALSARMTGSGGGELTPGPASIQEDGDLEQGPANKRLK